MLKIQFNGANFILRGCFLSVVLFFGALFSAAADAPRNHIYFDGRAETADQRNYFMENFRMEAEALGYTPESVKESAAYTFRFDVSRNIVTYDDGTTEAAPPDEPQFILTITLTSNEDGTELVSFGFPFFALNDMYEYNQLLFVRTVSNIPVDPNAVSSDDAWRHKWLYIMLSVDYPINFYMLQGTGLKDDVSIFYPKDDPYYFSAIDNRVVAMPGISAGLEVQFLSWKNIGISAEPKFQIGWESLNNTYFFLMTAGLDLKVPIKIGTNIMLEPYLAGRYILPFSLDIDLDGFSLAEDVFRTLPDFGIGGGLQFGMKAGKAGVAFFDINCIYYFNDFGIKNHYTFKDPKNPTAPELSTKPDVIYFKRLVIGLAIGFKFGLFDRNKRPRKSDDDGGTINATFNSGSGAANNPPNVRNLN